MKYVNRKTNEPVDLRKINEEMCKDQEIEVDPEHNCSLYEFCVDVGSMSHLQNEKGEIIKVKLREFLNEDSFAILTQKQKSLAVKYLCDEYKFVSENHEMPLS